MYPPGIYVEAGSVTYTVILEGAVKFVTTRVVLVLVVLVLLAVTIGSTPFGSQLVFNAITANDWIFNGDIKASNPIG